MENNHSEFDLTDIINKPKQNRDRLRAAENEMAKIFANTFETEAGKKALNILSYNFFSQEVFQGREPNPFAAAKRDGQRDVVSFIYAQIQRAKHG